MKKLFSIISICFIVAFTIFTNTSNSTSFVSAQTPQEEEILIHPTIIGFQPHNYFYACTYTTYPAQIFSWFTYTDYDPDYNIPWSLSSFDDGSAIIINTGLLGLSGKIITAISILATSSLVNTVPTTMCFLGNVDLPNWDTVNTTVDTSSSVHASEFLNLNYRTPEQFFDNVIFTFTSDSLRYNFPVPYTVGDAIIIKHDFSGAHFIRSIRLYVDNSQYIAGYEQGFADGYEQGLTDGYTQGYNDGYDIGYNDGYYTGDSYQEGYNNGYQDGYNAGISGTVTTNWFTSFVNSVFDIFNIEIFPNVKIIHLFFIPIGLGIILLILKLIRG